MKAAVLYGKDDLRYEDYPTPIAADGEVLVRVRATGICGSDIPRVLENGAHYYPIVLGYEFSGDVVEKGNRVTLFSKNCFSNIPVKNSFLFTSSSIVPLSTICPCSKT